MFKLRYIITELLYIMTGYLYKINGPFRYCAHIINRYRYLLNNLNPKLKGIIITLSLSFLAYLAYLSIRYTTLDQPLYCAAADNNIFEAKRLLKEGADPNQATWEDGSTALQEAKKYEYNDMVNLLIKYGAKH